MPREFIASDGRIFFRTKLLSAEQAQRFAACLTANATRFCDVEWLLSEKAKGERAYFVQFRPVNADRQWEQIARQQDARRLRAMEEGACYVFVLDMDSSSPFYWTYNPRSGETYQTDAGSCSCPDFEFRCKKLTHAALYCKHIHALLYAMQIREVLPLSEVFDLPEWQARHLRPRPATYPPLPVAPAPAPAVLPAVASSPAASAVEAAPAAVAPVAPAQGHINEREASPVTPVAATPAPLPILPPLTAVRPVSSDTQRLRETPSALLPVRRFAKEPQP